MAAATDFLYDEQVVDALCSELRSNLPSSWAQKRSRGGNLYFSLARGPEFGDLRDYRLEPDETWLAMCPLIFVKCTGNQRDIRRTGIGGKEGVTYQLRVVHLWSHDQCRDQTTRKRIEPARSRCQRLKTLNKAVFATDRKLGEPTLTNADGLTATVMICEYVGAYLQDVEDVDMIPAQCYAIAIDLSVTTCTR